MMTSLRLRERALAGILEMTQEVLRCGDLDASRRVAVAHVRRLFGASGTAFIAPGRPVPLGPNDAVLDGLVSDLPSLYAHYLHEDPGLPILQRARLELRPLVLTSRVLFRSGHLLRSRYYTEVMYPRAMHHALALIVAAERRPHGVIVVYRGRDQAPFQSWEVGAAMSAIPVLASAFDSVGRIGRAREPALQSIVVLDEKLHVLYRDTSGPAHLTDWLAGPWQDRDELRPFVQRCRALLAGDPGPAEIVLPVRAENGMSMNIAIELKRIARPDSARLVLLMRPSPLGYPDALIGLRLSRRELEVANLIAAGASHAEIATRLSMSVHTVAHHAGAVYRKTFVGNRATLAARLAVTLPRPETIPALTTREHEVTALVLEGSSNKEIAARLGLSIATVSNHLQKIYRKADVHDRVALVRRLCY